ncbi:MAG: arylsulfatase, partial [Candidatus Hydrogenedentes bacterium]|nr:arylsulfatase [Candidatus Hydrogenedentota bacterium]
MNYECTRRTFLASSMAALGASCATRGERPGAAGLRPNIVIILADDMGVGDVQALWPAGKIPTPHLDRFVHEGRSFTDAHSASAVCSPTRYGLLTGRYAWRTRLQEWVMDAYEPPLIAPDRLTLPQLLRDHGYATACIGKWHLGREWTGEGEGRAMKLDITAPIRSGPTTRGFDYYFGTDVPNFPPFTFLENDSYVIPPTDTYQNIPGIHVGFEGAPMAPGWRFDQILPTLTERAVKYVHDQAQTKRPFFLFFSMTSPHEPLAPSPPFQGKSGISPVADFIMETDWSAGQVLQALENAGVADDTLVIFATDNGHSHYTGWETLVEHGHLPSGPYRGHKSDIWEGGHRVPFVVRWPGVVPPGTQCSQLICHNDLMATCAALLGAHLPENAGEDSVNMLPAYIGAATASLREDLVHHDVGGRFALRQGPWKLVLYSEKAPAQPQLQLYNLAEDLAETTDLAAQHPEKMDSMTQHLQEIVNKGRSTPGPPQANDTPDIDILHRPAQRWGR